MMAIRVNGMKEIDDFYVGGVVRRTWAYGRFHIVLHRGRLEFGMMNSRRHSFTNCKPHICLIAS